MGASAAKFLFHVPPPPLKSHAIDLVDGDGDRLNMVIAFHNGYIYSITVFNKSTNVLMYQLDLFRSRCQPQTLIDALTNKDGRLARYYSQNKLVIFYDHMITCDDKITQFNDQELQKIINVLQQN